MTEIVTLTPSSSVSFWTEVECDDIQQTTYWTPDRTNTNAAIIPTGTGAFSLACPDNLASGGNARGDNAVDLQISRLNADQVASGNRSAIFAGKNNKVNGQDSATGGVANSNLGVQCIIYGENNASQAGVINSAAFGKSNAVNGNQAFAVGSNHVIQGNDNFGAGRNNLVAGNQASVFGQDGQSAWESSMSHAADAAWGSTRGDVQNNWFILSADIDSTDAATFEYSLDGVPAGVHKMIPIADDMAWMVIVNVIATCYDAGTSIYVVGDSLSVGYNLMAIKIIDVMTLTGAAGGSVRRQESGTFVAAAGGVSFSVVAVGGEDALQVTWIAPANDGDAKFKTVAYVQTIQVQRS